MIDILRDLNREAPYSQEIDFYKQHNIPLWETYDKETIDLGVIWTDPDGSWIKAKVDNNPIQHWLFDIYSVDQDRLIHIETGSGGLTNFYPTMVLIAEGMIHITKIETV